MFLHYTVQDLVQNYSYGAFIMQQILPACPSQIPQKTLAHRAKHDEVCKARYSNTCTSPIEKAIQLGVYSLLSVHAQLPLAVDWSSSQACRERNKLLLIGCCSSLFLSLCMVVRGIDFYSFIEMIVFKVAKEVTKKSCIPTQDTSSLPGQISS